MNEILVAVQPYSDVCEGAEPDYEKPNHWGKVASCYVCGGLLFYQVTARIDDTKLASDTHIYCAVCGRDNGGFYDDPLDEMNLTSVQSSKLIVTEDGEVIKTHDSLSETVNEE